MASARGQRGRDRQTAAGREVGAILLLLEDVRVALLVLNAARYRALERWLGLGRTEANLVTLVAAGVVADSMKKGALRLTAPSAPGASDFALGAAAAESVLWTVAGRTASGAAPGSLLLTVAIAYKLVGGPARRAARGIARSPFRLRTAVMEQAQRMATAAAAAAARATEPQDEPGQATPAVTPSEMSS
ncbi:MAG: hypothetical protein ACJ780_00935 [Solirubrobacteraceae bacterium]